VSVIDTASRQVSDRIALGTANHIPTAIALNGATAWVTCNVTSTLALIDTATNTVSQTVQIGLGDEPTGIAFA
jgi:YVTN family beta-propeller protein